MLRVPRPLARRLRVLRGRQERQRARPASEIVPPVGAQERARRSGAQRAGLCGHVERGFPTHNYDLFFYDDEALLSRKYDFVVCTEVLEHLRRPADDLARLEVLLKPGGLLGVMTGVLEDDASFGDWWYRRDFTHICFYRPETLAWIARRFGWELSRPSRDAALFRKTRIIPA